MEAAPWLGGRPEEDFMQIRFNGPGAVQTPQRFSATRPATPILASKTEVLFSGKSAPKLYSFGTSGYRAIEEFDEKAVRQIAAGIADYLITEMEKTGKALPVVIGGDTRDKTREFLPLVAKILTERGLDVYQADGDVPTPVLAFAVEHFASLNPKGQPAAGAVLMTASHNPWEYGGFNFLTPDGAVAPTEVSNAFSANQLDPKNKQLDRKRFGLKGKARIKTFDPYPIYKQHLLGMGIDFEAIKNSGVQIFYDPLYATGRRVFPRLLQEAGIDATVIHNTDVRPADYTGMPEPTGKELNELAALVRSAPTDFKNKGLKIGLATDGDADRFGILDEKGDYVVPNDVLALITHHLMQNKGQRGVIVRNQASSHLLDAIARQNGLDVQETPVGYKYLAGEIIARQGSDNPVLIAGESSGGITVLGHIPEKDGILANLLIAELVAMEGKPLSQILKDLKANLPEKFAARELTVTTAQGKDIVEGFRRTSFAPGQIGGINIDPDKSRTAAEGMLSRYSTYDGSKMYLEDGSWILIRNSGTEPKMRVFVEAVGATDAEAEAKRARLQADTEALLASEYGIGPTDIVVKN